MAPVEQLTAEPLEPWQVEVLALGPQGDPAPLDLGDPVVPRHQGRAKQVPVERGLAGEREREAEAEPGQRPARPTNQGGDREQSGRDGELGGAGQTEQPAGEDGSGSALHTRDTERQHAAQQQH